MKSSSLLLVAPLLAGCLVNTTLHERQRSRFDCLDERREQGDVAPFSDTGLTIDDIPLEGCTPAVVRTWYADCDGDGWGTFEQDIRVTERELQESEPPSCDTSPDGVTPRWVRNDLDCDDGRSDSGGRGGVCPADFVETWSVRQVGEVEFLLAIPDAPISAGSATSLCASWATDGVLASLDDDFRLGQTVDWVQADFGFTPPLQTYVDVRYDPTLEEWVWGSGGLDNVGFCTESPDPSDLPPAVQDDLETLRLAIQAPVDEDLACLDLPIEVTRADAFLCQRARLSPVF